MHKTIHLWNPYDKMKFDIICREITTCLIFDPRRTLKVNGGHLGNARICGISEKIAYALLILSTKSRTFNKYRIIIQISCA